MTVSRALRGEKHVAAPLRQRVAEVAAEIGYQPDPEIVKLMAHMRRARKNLAPQVLALVWADREPGGEVISPWSARLRMGAVQRAEALGYRLDEFHLREKGMTARRLSGILEARGIAGVVLTPLLTRSRGHVSMAWEKFSSVAIGIGYSRPALHRVHHHHYVGMLTAMRQLKKLGYRRIGLFGPTTVNERMFGAWSASFLMHHPLPVRQAMELVCLQKTPTQAAFQAWLTSARPEVVLDAGSHYDWLQAVAAAGEVGYAALNWTPDHPERAGIDQQAEVLGAAALDLLAGQLQHNERGIP
ncbi:MAG TPA: LacI family DNA-binding transcriptional regulator, partial [Prosthecobacter sp.]|nr:LacI family DNA-binding transcriptional regulator [Prosthecobacter sp.]